MVKTAVVPKDPCGDGDGGREMRYKGVRKRKQGKKWVSEVRIPNSRERIWLGSYDTPEMAARAFDVAVLCIRGREANGFNFPDDVPTHIVLGRDQNCPMPSSEIRAAVAEFARNYSSKMAANVNEPGIPIAHRPSSEKELSTSLISPDESFTTAESTIDGGMDWSFIDSFFYGDDGFAGYFMTPTYQDLEEPNEGGGGFALPQSPSFLWNF